MKSSKVIKREINLRTHTKHIKINNINDTHATRLYMCYKKKERTLSLIL